MSASNPALNQRKYLYQRDARGWYQRRCQKKWRRRQKVVTESSGTLDLEGVVSTGNLLRVFHRLKKEGGQAPGSDALRYQDLGRSEAAEVLRETSRVILAGKYRPQPEREVSIPKASGGTRTLRLASIVDRVVATAVHEAIEPTLEKLFLPQSHGFRKNRGVWTALAHLKVMAEKTKRWVITSADIQKAFDCVPVERLLTEYSAIVPDKDLQQLLYILLQPTQERRTGIPQGSPLSPGGLNLYMHHRHDTPLRKITPLWIRYADDLAYLSRSVTEGGQLLSFTSSLLQQGSLKLKDSTQTRNLKTKEVEHLGFKLTYRNGEVTFSIPNSSWKELEEKLLDAHREPNPLLLIRNIIMGWVSWVAPSFGRKAKHSFLGRVKQIAERVGCSELTLDAIEQTLVQAEKKWKECLQKARALTERDLVLSAQASA